jgi:putative transposase
VQSVKGNGYAGRATHGRERKRKKDIRSKIANIVSNTARNLNAVIVLENLPEQCPRNMIRDVRDPALRHRIYQAGFRGMVKAIEEKCLERGVSVVKVDPRNTSSTCPFCGSKLMRGSAVHPRAVIYGVLRLFSATLGFITVSPGPLTALLERFSETWGHR